MNSKTKAKLTIPLLKKNKKKAFKKQQQQPKRLYWKTTGKTVNREMKQKQKSQD